MVRYPCEIIFDAAPLGPGELAHPLPKGETPEDGFNMCVRPSLLMRLPEVVYVVIYQLGPVNYGEFASADDAEVLVLPHWELPGRIITPHFVDCLMN